MPLFVCVGFYATSTVLQSLHDVRLTSSGGRPRNLSELYRRTKLWVFKTADHLIQYESQVKLLLSALLSFCINCSPVVLCLMGSQDSFDCIFMVMQVSVNECVSHHQVLCIYVVSGFNLVQLIY